MAMPTLDKRSGSDSGQRMERLENRCYGKHRGVVIDNADPDKLGRLRVWVPSLFPRAGGANPGADDPSVTDWAWPCLPYGGSAQQGFFFVPDVGAKVWVEFEEGNLDSPIWVGVFWSRPGGTSDVPESATEPDAPTRRLIRTACGHEMVFDDKPGEESITLRHKDGALISFDSKGSLTLANKNGTFLYLNAGEAELSFADENGNNLRLGEQNVTLTNAAGTVLDIAGDAVQVVAKHVMLRSDTVALGEGAMEPAILGTAFAAIFDSHIHPTAMGPSGPPLPVPMPLSSPMHPAISKSVKVKA